jgi:hypothetical protein
MVSTKKQGEVMVCHNGGISFIDTSNNALAINKKEDYCTRDKK